MIIQNKTKKEKEEKKGGGEGDREGRNKKQSRLSMKAHGGDPDMQKVDREISGV